MRHAGRTARRDAGLFQGLVDLVVGAFHRGDQQVSRLAQAFERQLALSQRMAAPEHAHVALPEQAALVENGRGVLEGADREIHSPRFQLGTQVELAGALRGDVDAGREAGAGGGQLRHEIQFADIGHRDRETAAAVRRIESLLELGQRGRHRFGQLLRIRRRLHALGGAHEQLVAGSNIGFAQLQMKQDLGFSDAMYGFGAAVFALVYFSLTCASLTLSFWMPLRIRDFGVRDVVMVSLYSVIPNAIVAVAVILIARHADRRAAHQRYFAPCTVGGALVAAMRRR